MLLLDQQQAGADATVQIAGAGPSGLVAAIIMAKAGKRVVVHEAQPEVGSRFQGDLQGLENWTTEQDVLEWLRGLGLSTDFAAIPCRNGVAFDAWGKSYGISSPVPLFYLVERGSGEGSLDSALLRQALRLGVEVRFNSRLEQLEGAGIIATGPKAADAIGVGYHFDTSMEDGFWAICDDELAPKGYAYLLVMNGKGTVKSCMFSGFKQEKLYVERTVAAFQELVGLEMQNPRAHGGVGNFRIPASAFSGHHPLVGEQAGFQDTLWGFGMRLAITSGILAARSLLENKNYDDFWHQNMQSQLQASVVNRVIYGALGNRGYRWLLLRQLAGKTDVRHFLRGIYAPSWWHSALLPWAQRHYQSSRKDSSCDHVDCTCVWCRHGHGAAALDEQG
ncbi:MAG: NAD(P)/FAD-dependent oxidoreductase [Gallionellaceae bacterium]|nr:NAD(P)/FAD-dependent oxidoreductase [Gallionellaceae bacterium]